MSREAIKQALEALEEATIYTNSSSFSPSLTRECKTAAAALREALAEQPAQQEPGRNHWEDGDVFERIAARATQPTQRPWVGLTDAEMWELWNSQGDDAMEQQVAIAFARAIEAALRSKNENNN